MAKSDFEWLLREPLKAGEQKLRCICAADRTGFNKHQRTLSVNNESDRILYHCWHCGEKDAIRKEGLEAPRFKPRESKPVSKPIGSIYELNEDCYDWLEQERGYSRATVDAIGFKRGKVRGTDAIACPYYSNGNITGYKLVSIEIPKKEGRYQITGHISGLFMSHLLDFDLPHLIICEGEFDPGACLEAGIKNAVSIPHGAISPGTTGDTTKLACLSEAADIIKRFKKIIIATDTDAPGLATYAEIARRVGRYRSYKPLWPDAESKWDANEVLLERGPDALRKAIEGAEAEAIPGLAQPKDFRGDLIRFRNGDVLRGESTGYHVLDPFFRMTPGVMTTITGTPGSGKSEMMDQLHVNMAESHNWKTVLWSRENAAFVHVSKLIEKRARKRFHQTMNNVMTDDEMELHLDWVNDHFTFLTHEEDASIDSILDRMSAAVLRHGVKLAAIDPYNYVQKTGDAREDLQVSEMLTKITDWTKNHEAHCFLVAHPTKLVTPGVIPNGNHISGGANFWNKTDFGVTIHRPNDGHVAEFHVWKVRHSWLGKIGKIDLAYDTKTASYYDPDGDDAPIKIRPPSRSDYRYNPDDYSDDDGDL